MDFIAINEGKTDVMNNGLPATCLFDLSSKTADEIGAEATFAGGFGKIGGTGYATKEQAEVAAVKGKCAFAKMVWDTVAAADWPAGVKSCVLRDGEKLIAVWNLQAGGVARDMSKPNTKQEFTPTLELT